MVSENGLRWSIRVLQRGNEGHFLLSKTAKKNILKGLQN